MEGGHKENNNRTEQSNWIYERKIMIDKAIRFFEVVTSKLNNSGFV